MNLSKKQKNFIRRGMRRAQASRKRFRAAAGGVITACQFGRFEGAQFDELVALLDVPERGNSRIYFLRPIKQLGGEKGKELLKSLQRDPTFGREAKALLGK
jgi:hypothetical protein